MDISNCRMITYNGSLIQRILYRGYPCYNLMRINIVYEDGSFCTSVNFDSAHYTSWHKIANMYSDIFYVERDMICINKRINMPDGYHYVVKNRNGENVTIFDTIIFDSNDDSTTYTVHLITPSVSD